MNRINMFFWGLFIGGYVAAAFYIASIGYLLFNKNALLAGLVIVFIHACYLFYERKSPEIRYGLLGLAATFFGFLAGAVVMIATDGTDFSSANRLNKVGYAVLHNFFPILAPLLGIMISLHHLLSAKPERL
jgi:hypothetical protein